MTASKPVLLENIRSASNRFPGALTSTKLLHEGKQSSQNDNIVAVVSLYNISIFIVYKLIFMPKDILRMGEVIIGRCISGSPSYLENVSKFCAVTNRSNCLIFARSPGLHA